MYRQGDLLIVPIREVPQEAVESADGIVMRGEATGHAHRVDPGKATVLRGDGRIFLEVRESVNLFHEEHHPFLLRPGAYEVIRQREYDGEHWFPVSD